MHLRNSRSGTTNQSRLKNNTWKQMNRNPELKQLQNNQDEKQSTTGRTAVRNSSPLNEAKLNSLSRNKHKKSRKFTGGKFHVHL
mmetsp:Transcript_14520/g.16946  ORF Transcript_14520/g.16946 Transcript_14520/m.16946 type:complete len:84 (+) Transcript_14520:555-806(+)